MTPRCAFTRSRKRGPRARGGVGTQPPATPGAAGPPRTKRRTRVPTGSSGDGARRGAPRSERNSPHRLAPPSAGAEDPLPSSRDVAPPLLFWTWDPRWKLVPQTSLAARSTGRDSQSCVSPAPLFLSPHPHAFWPPFPLLVVTFIKWFCSACSPAERFHQ